LRDRKLSYEQILAMLDREVSIMEMRNVKQHDADREYLVEKYGEEGVVKVEKSILGESWSK